MKAAFEKIIERLERERDIHKHAYDVTIQTHEKAGFASYARACDEAIEIVKEVASNSEIPNMSENLTSSEDEILNINGIFDILDQFHFFLGQRAGRELWGDKPRAVQDRDIANFNRNLQIIRNYIKQNTASSDVPDINVGEIEEFCEWKREVYYDKCPHEEGLFKRVHYDESVKRAFNYCPYCGKKIKVVE